MFSERIDIRAPASEVWRHLSDPALMANWIPGITSVRSRDGGPVRTGSCLEYTGRGRESLVSVIDSDPGVRLVLGSENNGFTATYTYAMTPGDDGTVTVSLDATCTARGIARCAAPFVRAMIRKADRWQLAYLKGVVERARDEQGGCQA